MMDAHLALAGGLQAISPGVLLVLAVVGIVEIALDAIALVDLYRRPTERVVLGNKWVWVVVILFVNLIGPILYLVAGRKPPPAQEPETGERSSERAQSIVDSLYGSAGR